MNKYVILNSYYSSSSSLICSLFEFVVPFFETFIATMLSSSFYTSLRFFLFTCICINSIFPASSSSSSSLSSSSANIYAKHCSSIVPESSTTIRTDQCRSVLDFSTTYFTGGDRLLDRKPGNQTYYYVGKYLRFQLLPDYYETIAKGTYKVEGFLYIRQPYNNGARRDYRSVRFWLTGFSSEISRKLCMVGSASWEVDGGKIINLDAVLKLNHASEINPTIYTGLVRGTLESTGSASDPGYFDPILIFDFPVLPNYNYSLVSKEPGMFSSNFDDAKKKSLSLLPTTFCSALGERRTYLELEYAEECREPQHCSPLGAGDRSIGFLPRFLSLSPFQCSGAERKLRFVATFRNINYDDQSLDFDLMLIGEASWDDKNNKLFGVACRILNPADHFGNPVGDCTMRLSLRFPSILTIRNDAIIVGQIWSTKTVEDSYYFRKISLTGYDELGGVAFLGPRYEYMESDRVRKSCPERKPVTQGNTYPDRHSYDVRFDMSIENSKGEEIAWVSAAPLSVGSDLYNMIAVDSVGLESAIDDAAIFRPEKGNNTSTTNISYKMSIYPHRQVKSSSLFWSLNWSRNPRGQVEITAEGVYNAETGYLCMVGCRKLEPYIKNSTYVSRDCEILVKVEFAPLNGTRRSRIKGTIKSTRAKTDPLYFEDLIMQSVAYYTEEAGESIWRMDLEMTMVLISNMLACVFVGLQILHVKRNPEVYSFISLVMLLILSLGHMIPLVLNFEAMFLGKHNKQPLLLSNGGRLDASEVTVRVINMVAFLLIIFLLQLVWTAKQGNSNQKSSWIGEKKAAFISLSLYILGGLLTLLLNWSRNKYGHQAVSQYRVYQNYSVWGDLWSYAGLILDGFLLPQVILNILRGSAEKALSHPFYVGSSAVRLLPHAYNQYRVHKHPIFHVKKTPDHANPAAEFYSTAWDVIIPCGVVALAVIVFLQQRYGGCCMLPQRVRRSEVYEKVPTFDSE